MVAIIVTINGRHRCNWRVFGIEAETLPDLAGESWQAGSSPRVQLFIGQGPQTSNQIRT